MSARSIQREKKKKVSHPAKDKNKGKRKKKKITTQMDLMQEDEDIEVTKEFGKETESEFCNP